MPGEDMSTRGKEDPPELRIDLERRPGATTTTAGWRNPEPERESSAVGDESAGFLVLADAASSAQSFVSVFIGVYVLLIFAYVITSLIPGGASSTLERIRQFLYDVCEPYLRIFRRVIPPLGPLDLSPIVAIFVLLILERVLNALIGEVL
mgnify:CR=1 FL=1